ncbi:hypothetical protein MMC17_000894 [Xylographa soralifera]|nr:hypothetical protein [Xylographa soralifera]
MVKKGKVEAVAESVPQPVIQPTEALHKASMEPENTPAESGKGKCRFAETRNVAVHDRPTSSPYTTHPYTLLIGSSRVKYTILEDYLRFCPKWSEKCNFHSDPLAIIDLTADVHDDAGHTLVHYLNTGTYQTLKLPGKSGIGQQLADYKTSVLVYCVARNHGLPGLETLAKLHVTASGESLPFFDLLDITAAVYGELPAGEQWFVTFLKSTIDAAFRSDRDLFRRDAFLNRIGDNRSFNLVLINSIVRNLTESNETTSKHSGPVSRQSSRGGIRASDFQNTTVELVIPVAAEKDPVATKADSLAAKEEHLAAKIERVFAKEEPIATKEDPLSAKWTSSSLQERGRSPGPRASSFNYLDNPFYQTDFISCEDRKGDTPLLPSPTPAPLTLGSDDEIHHTPESQAEAVPIAPKQDKKKSKKHQVPLPLPMEDAFIAPKKEKKKGKKSVLCPPTPLPPLESCSFSIEHLQTEGWKHCIPCRARVQQLGLQLKQDEALYETY